MTLKQYPVHMHGNICKLKTFSISDENRATQHLKQLFFNSRMTVELSDQFEIKELIEEN